MDFRIFLGLCLIFILLSTFYFLFSNTYIFADSTSVSITVSILACSDGIDNDNDGLIDYPDDPGCDSINDNDETDSITYQCSDGIDNDSDGKTDYPNDLGCDSSTDGNEYNAPIGGGGILPPVTKAVFTGKAYPYSKITLLKDAVLEAVVSADEKADFKIALSGLSAGNYLFSFYSHDSQGRSSSLSNFSVFITEGATTNVSNIVIAPTLASDKSEVRKGNIITIFGQAAALADIVIDAGGKKEFSVKTKSDKDGFYSYNLNTLEFDYGLYNLRAKTFINDKISSNYSKLISFNVGLENIMAELITKCPEAGDLNNDCRVDLVDFSILIYWFTRPSPPAKVDLFSDNKADLLDFSIMAYYWTG